MKWSKYQVDNTILALGITSRITAASAAAVLRNPLAPHGAQAVHVQPPWSYGQIQTYSMSRSANACSIARRSFTICSNPPGLFGQISTW